MKASVGGLVISGQHRRACGPEPGREPGSAEMVLGATRGLEFMQQGPQSVTFTV